MYKPSVRRSDSVRDIYLREWKKRQEEPVAVHGDSSQARLLAVARAASWFVEVTPEKDLYYALNKYCVEAVDAMIKAVREVEHLLD